jgi:hypothetical protein
MKSLGPAVLARSSAAAIPAAGASEYRLFEEEHRLADAAWPGVARPAGRRYQDPRDTPWPSRV